MPLDPAIRNQLLAAQRTELTEAVVYRRLAAKTKDPHNRQVLEQIAGDEERHAAFWKQQTGVTVVSDKWTVAKYTFLGRTLGLTFVSKLMERGEQKAQVNYAAIASAVPEAQNIEADENRHEQQLIAMIDEKRLTYMGSIVLGLNDALVELTGALAGFTLALQSAHLIAAVGLITGIAASLSMAASEFLSTESEAQGKHAGRAALYTGITYIATVTLLILPFLILSHIYVSLAISFGLAALVIAGYTAYTAVAQGLPFGRRFVRMAGLSFGVAVISFGIGFVIRRIFHVSV